MSYDTKILWTGGLDSTFQLLRLLLVEKKNVAPYYMIDANRKSLSMEINTMQNIRKLLFEMFPRTQELLRPIKFSLVSEIPSDEEITEAEKKIY